MESLEHNNGNHDELILQQQREIEKQFIESAPMVSEEVPLHCLLAEYSGDVVFSAKVENLSQKYKYFRRIRPDGNCFFRAFAFLYLEYLVGNIKAYRDFKIFAQSSKSSLIQLGYPSYTLDDFHATFMDVINRINPENPGGTPQAKNELDFLLNEPGFSDYVVVYLRLITSGKLQDDADFYQNFIDGDLTIEEFRHQEVEPMFRESDHIHIIALCSALGVGVRVEYLDRAEGGFVKAHDFPEGSPPLVYLLYRPGHYDILYPK